MQKYMKNGKEYERREKKIDYDTNINIKISSKLKQDFEDKCKSNDIEISTKIRELMNKYVNGEMI